jgi:hypothetical protein
LTTAIATMPDYAPVPRSALGPALNEQDYVGRVERNLYWVTDGTSNLSEDIPGVIAAADVFTESTTFWVMESIRLDLGYGSQVHP